jgi:HSP20 family molecular chaperone IbpA
MQAPIPTRSIQIVGAGGRYEYREFLPEAFRLSGQEVGMNIVKRTPFRDFENFMSGWQLPWAHEGMDVSRAMAWRPSVDITEEDKEFLIKVEIPEVKKSKKKISSWKWTTAF